MRWIWTSLAVAGLPVIAVGVLWFLQGSDLVHIEPIACATDCEPLVGHRPAWQAAGAAAILTGALSITLATRKLRR